MAFLARAKSKPNLQQRRKLKIWDPPIITDELVVETPSLDRFQKHGDPSRYLGYCGKFGYLDIYDDIWTFGYLILRTSY